MTAPVLVRRLFDWKVRGIRWIEIIGMVCVAALVFSVYIAKTAAARESAEIGKLEGDISDTRQRVRLLRAEISRLEQPSRLEALSRQVGLAPVEARRQATESQLTHLGPAPAMAATARAPQPVAPSVADEAVR